MADNKFELQVFCTEHNLIRSTYFSDTYRASFELDGITKSWDITHISLPFSEEKERLLQARLAFPATNCLSSISGLPSVSKTAWLS